MLQQIGLLVVVLATSAWGRGEFRLGGADAILGRHWSPSRRPRTCCSMPTAVSSREVTIGAVAEEVSVRFNTAGVDTLIDFADGGLRPVYIDPSTKIWRCRSRNAEDIFTRPAFTAIRTW